MISAAPEGSLLSVPLNVLIADDDATTRALFAAFVRSMGYAVTAVANGREAWSVFETTEPQLLIVDELSLGLAPVVAKELFRTLSEIRAHGVTVLLVEQNVQQSLRLADRAYVLESGKMVLDGPSGALLQNEDVRRAYLGEI